MSRCVAERVRHNPASYLAALAVHTDPPREPGSAHVEPLAGLALVGKHWWSWEDDKISFKQYWKVEESLPKIPAPVLGVKDFLHFPSVLDQVLKLREWQQIRNKAWSGKKIRSVAAMTPNQAKQMAKSQLPKIVDYPASSSSGAKKFFEKGLWAVRE